MMEHPVWREESGGALVAETGRFSLIVHRAPDRWHARFLVLARQQTGADRLVGSGSTDGLSEAMRAAQRMAERLRDVAAKAKKLVIVADRDACARQVAVQKLRDSGYHVSEATSGEGILRRLERTTRPTTVVVDANLGTDMTIPDLVAGIHQYWPVTGLLVTGAERPSAKTIAGLEFLAKPFTGHRLVRCVAAIITQMQPPPGHRLN